MDEKFNPLKKASEYNFLYTFLIFDLLLDVTISPDSVAIAPGILINCSKS